MPDRGDSNDERGVCDCASGACGHPAPSHAGSAHARPPHGRRRPPPKADRIARDQSVRLRRLRAALRRPLQVPEQESVAADTDEALDDEPDEPPVADARIDPDDDLPERMLYRDTGCHVAPACLNCPLPRCIFDRPPDAARQARARRNRRIRALMRQGWTTDRIARQFGISPAQVRRIRGPRRKKSE